ncbi:MAG: di-trans,poly-cis-decaprenylcistransferase [Pantoea sp. Brub]|nr:di-trans,poly-cis-decaprenylcistransferase [Pantoea sp. Brub]
MLHNKKNNRNCIKNPRHVAIIMDGNGRWARSRGQANIFGHRAGVKAIHRAINFAISNNIEALTLYAFSRENWNRPIKEVNALMNLFTKALDIETYNIHRHNIRLYMIGDISRFSYDIQNKIYNAEKLTKNNKGLILNIAANYGGRWDIIEGIKKIAQKISQGLLVADEINEDTLTTQLCMKYSVPVDLVIRTGGELRISNFLLWQIAYSELYFTNVLWPDFNENIFKDALNSFNLRERRFGITSAT